MAVLLVLFLVYLWLIMPRVIGRADMSGMTGRVYAHRGMFENPTLPENSMGAFKKAVEHGYGIELDLHLTTDGEVIVYHDRELDRVAGVDKVTDDCTWAELSEMHLFDTEYTVPKFTDVLALVDGKVPLIVELKGTSSDTRLADAAWAILKDYGGLYCVESFNPVLIARFRKIAPQVATGILSSNIWKSDGHTARNLVLTTMATNVICRPDFVAYDHLHDGNIAFRLCKFFFRPYTAAWTLRKKEQFGRCKKSYGMLIAEKLPDIENG